MAVRDHTSKAPVRSDAGRKPTESLAGVALAIIAGAFGLFLLIDVLHYAGRGFDLTDEGYYLHWIARPWLYDASTTVFGFSYHPVYWLLGGNIVQLRQANLLALFVLSLILMWLLLARLEPRLGGPPYRTGAYAIGLSTAVFIFCHYWLPTPNYNSLNLQSILITAIGVLIAVTSSSKRMSVVAGVAIGFGGWLCFMAKPPSALLLAPAVAACLAVTGPRSKLVIVVAAAVAAASAIATAVAIDGSVPAFIDRLERGHELYSILSPKFELVELLSSRMGLQLAFQDKLLLASSFAAALVLSRLAAIRGRWSPVMAVAILLFLAAASAAAISGTIPLPLEATRLHAIWAGPITLAVVIGSVAHAWPVHDSAGPKLLPLALFFFVLPFVYTFGTTNVFWWVGIGASIFWTAGSVLLIKRYADPSRAVYGIGCLASVMVIATTLVVATSTTHPYLQPIPLYDQTTPIMIGPGNVAVDVTPDRAEHLVTLKDAAQRNGFALGEPIIDLTGSNPGTIFALGGTAPGQPWLLGAHEASVEFAEEVLNGIPCGVLAKAWVLVAPQGKRSLPESLLTTRGLDLPSYKAVGRVMSSGIDGGENILLKPMQSGPKVVEACEQARKR